MVSRLFRPLLASASFPDRLFACLAAAIATMLSIAFCLWLMPVPAGTSIMFVPLSASAVLLFAVPSSPLTQPWPVLGGNILSTLLGVASCRWIADPMLAAGVAVGGSILMMSILRCLHPPGGAAALTAVVGGPAIHAAGYGFAFNPVAIQSLSMVLVAMAFHRMTAHSYPHRPAAPPPIRDAMRTAAGFERNDIDRALIDMGEDFDIGRDDLDMLLSRAQLHAIERTKGG